MSRKDEFDDREIKEKVIDYFIAKLNKEEIDRIICLPSFTVDDAKFTKCRMSIFDGYTLKWIDEKDEYNRYALIEFKERFDDYNSPLIEYKKIYKWLEHYDKWKKFFYINLMPSGLWCLPVHRLELWKWADNLDAVEIDGVEPFKFNREKPRLGGETLYSDNDKRSLLVDKKHWVKMKDFRRNGDE